MVPLTDYKRIFSRPGRPAQGGDEGFELTASDERVLDGAWAEVADEDGTVQLPDQPTKEQIRNSRS